MDNFADRKYKIIPDNPAARLLSILEKSSSISFDTHEISGVVWARVLGVSPEPASFLPAYAQLFIVANDAYEKVIYYYPKQERLHLTWRDKIVTCLRNNSPYHHQWQSVISLISAQDVLDGVQAASDILYHHVRPSGTVEAIVDGLKEKFEEIKRLVEGDRSLSGYLKHFLIAQLSKILDFLEHYDLYGSSPIEDAIYSVTSNVELNKAKESGFTKKLITFLMIAASAITVINGCEDAYKNLSSFRDDVMLPAFEEKHLTPHHDDISPLLLPDKDQPA